MKKNYILTILGIVVMLVGFDLPLTALGKQEAKGSATADEPLILVLNYPYQIWSNEPTKIHLTLLKPDFKPAVGAVVQVNQQEVGHTNRYGVCIFDYVPGNTGAHQLEAVLKEWGKSYRVFKSFASNSRTESFRADRLYVYTDRGVYNPGQEVLIRMIAWQLKKEYFPVAGVNVELLLQNREGKVFSGEKLVTDDYGIASTRLPLASHLPEGDYELVVLFNQVRETASIRVERFVPPVIRIQHNLKRYLTDSQPQLETDLSLDYFTGGAVATAQLVLQVQQQEAVLFSREYAVKDGSMQLRLSASDLEEFRSELTQEDWFKLKLVVTDSYGQVAEVAWDMFYSARPFTTVLELDKDAYPAGEMVQMLAKIVDVDGQPAAGLEVVLTLQETGQEIPGKTDARGIAVLEFVMPETAVTVVLNAPGVSVPLAQRAVPFQTWKPLRSKVRQLPETAGTAITLEVEFESDYIPVEQIVHVDLTDISGALVESTFISVSRKGDVYTARGEVTAPTWGTMLVNLYCCAVRREDQAQPLSPQTVGFLTEGQHVTFSAGREVKILFDGLPATARPGQDVQFRIAVEGGKEEKSLGVSVVDDAVLSLLNPFIRAPYSHFYNPQAKVISTGGAGVLTWPVVDRNWGSPQQDIAYSNWGWKAPGALAGGSDSWDGAGPGMADEANEEEYMEMESASALLSQEMAAAPPSEPLSKLLAEPLPAPMIADKALLDDTRALSQDSTPAAPVIVIRTSFPETALWLPALLTRGNKAEVQFQLPDSLTTQKISVVASDKEGYIGLGQAQILVTQPLSIRSLLPAVLTRGDKLQVSALLRNDSERELTCRANLSSPDLTISGGPRSLVLAAGTVVVVTWQVEAFRPGPAGYTLSVEADGLQDQEVKSLYVQPAGLAQVSREQGVATRQAPYITVFNRGATTEYVSGHLNISLPGVLPALQGLQVFRSGLFVSPWTAAAATLMNAALLEYAQARPGDTLQVDQLRAEIGRSVAGLLAAQQTGGGWGWFRGEDTAPDLYFSLTCLRALAEAAHTGFPVPEAALRLGVDYLLSGINPQGLWSGKDGYFWEFYDTATDTALSADLFDVLLLAVSHLTEPDDYRSVLETIAGKIRGLLEAGAAEPLTVAAGLHGLRAYHALFAPGEPALAQAELLKQLLALKRRGYWEPHWYQAYGGMVELNARIIEILVDLEARDQDAVIREVVTWLLSTRDAWGAWHNELGTAAAVRGLLKAGQLLSDTPVTPGEIKVLVNGKQVANMTIDPADPWLSSAKLRFFDLTPFLAQGANRIEVQCNVNLPAAVSCVWQQWGGNVLVPAESLTISRKAPGVLAAGQPATVSLDLSGAGAWPFLQMRESIPANMQVVVSSLEELENRGQISGYLQVDNLLILSLVGQEPVRQLSYKLSGTTPGTTSHGGTTVTDGATGQVLAFAAGQPLVVK